MRFFFFLSAKFGVFLVSLG
uniref:Uncharacterized protein n=1 Tax=Rhizophora mucronata TaxID=61149 RepID=A0A2P2QHY9_RHIMU